MEKLKEYKKHIEATSTNERKYKMLPCVAGKARGEVFLLSSRCLTLPTRQQQPFVAKWRRLREWITKSPATTGVRMPLKTHHLRATPFKYSKHKTLERLFLTDSQDVCHFIWFSSCITLSLSTEICMPYEILKTVRDTGSRKCILPTRSKYENLDGKWCSHAYSRVWEHHPGTASHIGRDLVTCYEAVRSLLRFEQHVKGMTGVHY